MTVSIRYYSAMSTAARDIHDLIERLGNLVRADVRATCNAYGVRPVQLEALGFLARCNRYSDTPQAVAEYLGLTKGTVSQTLTVLEQKGLLRKLQDKNDKRVLHLKPTAKGHRLLELAIPAAALAAGITKLDKADTHAAVEALRLLLRSTQKANDLKTFATCHSCRFNQILKLDYLCGLTQEPLTESDVMLLCREHQYPLTIALK